MRYKDAMGRKPSPSGYTAEQIVKLRAERGWTQNDLAEKAKIARITVQRIEKGPHNAQRDNLEAIAKAFGVPLGDLLPTYIESSQKIVDMFLASEWAHAAKVTEADIEWMLSTPMTTWVGVAPSPELVLEALRVWRAAHPEKTTDKAFKNRAG